MLITILVMAVAVSLEPFRIGMTLLLLNRPKPMLQLLAFLCGGFTMGLTVGLIVLFGLRHRLPSTAAVTLPTVQMLIGAVALLAAVLVAADVTGRLGARGAALPTSGRRLLNHRSPWVAAVAGLGIALPSVDYLAALAVILASGAAATTQVGALVAFHLVAFALIEIPLLAYAFAPRQTVAVLAAVNDWLRARRRAEVAILLAVVGAVLLGLGVAGR